MKEMKYPQNQKSIIIIGGGPAGIACAIQLKRYDISALLIEKSEIGGLLINANRVENYLGFPDGICGEDIVRKIQSHHKKNEIETRFENVSSLEYSENKFIVTTTKNTYFSDIVVIASGTKPKLFDNLKIPEIIINKVFYEVKDIRDSRNKTIGIIGAGDAAFDYALNLGKNNKVNIFNKNKTIKCLPLLFRRSRNSNNITYLEDRNLIQLSESGNGIHAKFYFFDKDDNYLLDYIIFAIGRKPELDFLHSSVIDCYDELLKDKKLFVIGDVKNGITRQASIAAGDGVKTAMIIKELF
jgi:thioredoxin reductase (NADPH)